MVANMIDEARQARLTEAVAAAEAKTASEIVLLILSRAVDFRIHDIALGLLVGMVVPVLILPFAGIARAEMWAMEIIVALAAGGIFQRVGLWRRLIGRARYRAAIRQVAEAQFFAHGLRHTDDRAGVLIMVALRDHAVEILADDEAVKALPEGIWADVTATIVEAARRGQLDQGLIEAVTRIGDALGGPFPSRGAPKDSLPNLVLGD